MSAGGKKWFKKFNKNRKWVAQLAQKRGGKNHRAFDKHLKTNPTQAEIRVKNYLEQLGLTYAFQKRFEAFTVDFYLAKAKLVLEIDGKIHDQQKEYDLERDNWFKWHGYKVVRIRNESTKTLEDFKQAFRGNVHVL